MIQQTKKSLLFRAVLL